MPNERAEVAAIFGIPPDNVQVICPFVGGAFGTSLRTWPHVTLAAIALKQVQRPVKLVLTRRQISTRPGIVRTRMQHVALSATPDGKLQRVVHEATAETSRYEQFTESLTTVATYMYSCPNVRTRYRLLPRDTATPTHMRGPGEASGIYALESAMDELAHALKMDPVELRRATSQLDESANRPSRAGRCCSAWNSVPNASAGRGASTNPARCAMDDCNWAGAWRRAPIRCSSRRPARACACWPTEPSRSRPPPATWAPARTRR